MIRNFFRAVMVILLMMAGFGSTIVGFMSKDFLLILMLPLMGLCSLFILKNKL